VTHPKSAIEWAGIAKIFGLGKAAPAICQASTPLYPGEYFVLGGKQLCSVVYVNVKAQIYHMAYLEIGSYCGAVVGCVSLAGLTVAQIKCCMELNSLYNSIFFDPQMDYC
jgi:hypothetical protein